MNTSCLIVAALVYSVATILDPRLKNQHFRNHQGYKKLNTLFEDLAEKFCDEFGVGSEDEDSYSSSSDDTAGHLKRQIYRPLLFCYFDWYF